MERVTKRDGFDIFISIKLFPFIEIKLLILNNISLIVLNHCLKSLRILCLLQVMGCHLPSDLTALHRENCSSLNNIGEPDSTKYIKVS